MRCVQAALSVASARSLLTAGEGHAEIHSAFLRVEVEIMPTIASSGTLTDTAFLGHTFEVLFCIQMNDPAFKSRVVNIDYILRKDGQDVPYGPYDLRDSVSGEVFFLRKTFSGWKASVGRTATTGS